MFQHRDIVPAFLLLTAGALVSSSWSIVDPDALSHLATGRWILSHNSVPTTDPFTFVSPERPWNNPEWLGDVLWYSAYGHLGTGGVIAAKTAVLCVGFAAALALAIWAGANAWLAVSLMLSLMPASAARMTVRNHIHAYWLLPLTIYLADRARTDRRFWLPILLAGLLWANLHGSFLLGYATLVITAVSALVSGQDLDRRAWVAGVAVYPLLPFLGPQMGGLYVQLYDHAVGTAIYRSLLSEWESPLSAQAWIPIVPLHALTAITVGAVIRLRTRARRDTRWLLFFAMAAIASYSSRRFIPLALVLGAPCGSVILSRLLRSLEDRRRSALVGSAVATAAAFLLFAHNATPARADVLTSPRTPAAAARFLARSTAAGAHIYNTFNAGPWLLWMGQGHFLHYVDPRNHLGFRRLSEYAKHALTPRFFDEEVKRFGIEWALLRCSGPQDSLLSHLHGSGAWRLTYWDGYYAVFAHADSPGPQAFASIAPTLDFDEQPFPLPRDDVALLREQAPALADALEAYSNVSRGTGGATSQELRSAASALANASGLFPRSPYIPMYQAILLARLGQNAAAKNVLLRALERMPEQRVLRVLLNRLGT